MRIHYDRGLVSFGFWSGAKDLAAKMTEEEFDIVEGIMEECAPAEGWSETAVNDLFWFDGETIAEWLGTTEEEILGRE